MGLTVRKVERGDAERWRQLFDAYVAFYEEDVPSDVIELTFERVLSEADGMFSLVAIDDDGTIPGIAVSVLHRSSWSSGWYCYLEDLFVDSAVRGKGIGRALIEAVYAEADARGATRTYWATAHDNKTARSLYDQVGVLTPFVQYRRR